MPLSAILVLLLILISLSPITSPTSPAPASCTSVTSAASDLDSKTVLKALHWLKIPEYIHLKVLSVTYNSLQPSQPTYLCELLTIQPTRSIRSSSCLTLSRPPVTSLLPQRSHIHHCTTSLE